MPGYTEVLGPPLFLASAAALVGGSVWAFLYLRRGRAADELDSSPPSARPVPVSAQAVVGPVAPARLPEVNSVVPGVTFADVAGLDEAVEELRELKDYLLDPERFRRLGAKLPRGVLLVASPVPAKRS